MRFRMNPSAVKRVSPPFIASKRAERWSMFQSLQIAVKDANGIAVVLIDKDYPKAREITNIIVSALNKAFEE